MKKMALFVILFVALIALPMILLSDGCMAYYQSLVDENPNGSMARWAQLRIAGTYLSTLRSEQAIEGYKKFLERYPDDPRREWTHYRYCISMDEGGKKQDAIDALQYFLEQYPDSEYKLDVQGMLGRLKYVQK